MRRTAERRGLDTVFSSRYFDAVFFFTVTLASFVESACRVLRASLHDCGSLKKGQKNAPDGGDVDVKIDLVSSAHLPDPFTGPANGPTLLETWEDERLPGVEIIKRPLSSVRSLPRR